MTLDELREALKTVRSTHASVMRFANERGLNALMADYYARECRGETPGTPFTSVSSTILGGTDNGIQLYEWFTPTSAEQGDIINNRRLVLGVRKGQNGRYHWQTLFTCDVNHILRPELYG